MAYILEGQEEMNRLDHQALMKAYSLENEISPERLPEPNDRVLEVGCGHGSVCRYLASKVPSARISGIDYSPERITQARKASENASIDFQLGSAEKLPFETGSIDYLICRYVYEYFPSPITVSKEFYRVLGSNGKLLVIVFDGAFFNLHTIDQAFNHEIQEVQNLLREVVNCYVGRSVHGILQQVGFKITQLTPEVFHFSGAELTLEWENSRQRLELASELMIDKLGVERFNRFQKNYLEYLKDPHSFLFYNKFIIEAVKA